MGARGVGLAVQSGSCSEVSVPLAPPPCSALGFTVGGRGESVPRLGDPQEAGKSLQSLCRWTDLGPPTAADPGSVSRPGFSSQRLSPGAIP